MSRPRRTPQFEAVLAAVRGARDHPTAEQIHERVRAGLPYVSLGTVYRNLDKLVASGAIQLVQLGERQARFDGVIEAHDHFLCEACGAIADLEDRCDERFELATLAASGFTVRSITRVVRGRCPDCPAPERSAALAS